MHTATVLEEDEFDKAFLSVFLLNVEEMLFPRA
jgi:hypothetical protein